MSDLEWVRASAWTVSVGTRVRLTNDDGADVTVYVEMVADADYDGKPWLRSANTRYSSVDWTLWVAVPTPALPTVSGIYADNEGDSWMLDSDGEWHILSLYGEFRLPVNGILTPHAYAPFTRLEG